MERVQGTVVQVNVKGKVDQKTEVGLPKISISRLSVTTNGCGGDYNHYRQSRKKGTNDWAVSILASEIVDQLNLEGWPVKYADLGENITTKGIPQFEVGKKYSFGEVELQITEIIEPCNNMKFLPYVGAERRKEFIDTLEGRRGWFAKVLKEGNISPGDGIKMLE